MEERKQLIREYAGQGIKLDTALSAGSVTRHQFYHKPTGGRAGR